jgi:DNA-binding CsgD family transcriptional regulator
MENLNRFIIDLYDGAQSFSVSDFNEHVFVEFNKHVRFDSAVLVDLAVAPHKPSAIQSLNYYGTPIERFQDRNAVLGTEKTDQNGSLETRDSALKRAYLQRGKSVITDIAKTFSDKNVLRYCKKYETAHALTFLVEKKSLGIISTVSFGRASKKQAFQREHSHIADLLLPHILQARKINRSLKSNFIATTDESSTVLANFDGSLHFVDDKAIELLQLEWKQWAPPFLPAPLIDALKRNADKIFIGAFIKVAASVQGNMICVIVSAKNTQAKAISNAEYRVAKLAAEGLQYKEIARKLGISPATVRNQLHSVYEKLGVSNKAALASVLAT